MSKIAEEEGGAEGRGDKPMDDDAAGHGIVVIGYSSAFMQAMGPRQTGALN
jgi:hypothetical protein